MRVKRSCVGSRAVETRADLLGGQSRASGRLAAGDPLGQAEEVGADLPVAREERPGPPEADGDIIGDQEVHRVNSG